MLAKGLYIEFNPATTSNPVPDGRDDPLHTYIVYRDGKGIARVIRGGPSGFDEKKPTRSTVDNLRFGLGGKIEVQAGVPLDKSKDAYKPGETPEDRHATPLNIGTRDPEQIFDRMVRKAEDIHGLNVDYDLNEQLAPDQNSNSLTRALMDDAGIDTKTVIPEKIDRARIRGFENNLKEAQEEARRERNRPNPIEGEVGGTDDQNPTPSGDDPGFGNNGPTGQDDGADDDGPSRVSSSDSSSKTGQPQSANVTGLEATSRTMEIKPGEEAKGETMELKPEQRKLMDDIAKSDGALDEILAKDPRDLTEGEFTALKKEVINLPAGPEQDRLDGMATAFLDDKYGTGPVKYDAVGRMIDPKPIRPANKTPVPAKTPDGEPLTGAVKKIGGVIADAAGGEGRTSAVQDLQSGLNLLKSIMQRRAKTTPLAHDLKTDGVVGPKTRRALRIAATALGRPKIEEGFALGRFGNFARDIHSGRADTRSLKPTIDKAFGPLFRDPQSSRQSPSRPAEENLSFQATINDLGSDVFGREAFKPIREDGLIGPMTESAFNAVLPAAGPDRFTSRLGHNLGFFDDNDFGDFG